MSDPRPLAERLDAALTDEVLDSVKWIIGSTERLGYPQVRRVLTAALLPGDAMMRQLIGWLSGDIPELRTVEIPRLADSLDRFLSVIKQDIPPDDTLARVAPTCATCKHADVGDDVESVFYCHRLRTMIERKPRGVAFGCTLHEAVRPDAPEVK